MGHLEGREGDSIRRRVWSAASRTAGGRSDRDLIEEGANEEEGMVTLITFHLFKPEGEKKEVKYINIQLKENQESYFVLPISTYHLIPDVFIRPDRTLAGHF